jgi:hypothetical protein
MQAANTAGLTVEQRDVLHCKGRVKFAYKGTVRTGRYRRDERKVRGSFLFDQESNEQDKSNGFKTIAYSGITDFEDLRPQRKPGDRVEIYPGLTITVGRMPRIRQQDTAPSAGPASSMEPPLKKVRGSPAQFVRVSDVYAQVKASGAGPMTSSKLRACHRALRCRATRSDASAYPRDGVQSSRTRFRGRRPNRRAGNNPPPSSQPQRPPSRPCWRCPQPLAPVRPNDGLPREYYRVLAIQTSWPAYGPRTRFCMH